MELVCFRTLSVKKAMRWVQTKIFKTANKTPYKHYSNCSILIQNEIARCVLWQPIELRRIKLHWELISWPTANYPSDISSPSSCMALQYSYGTGPPICSAPSPLWFPNQFYDVRRESTDEWVMSHRVFKGSHSSNSAFNQTSALC
jgi:hypothetical protein